ncbi:MAG TPA: hypothetical protein VGS16_05050 [Candidatus Dormibacteraeota bacterium]|nr:hypothetical protein [Candidatus Dormibacteraeota bacterium]
MKKLSRAYLLIAALATAGCIYLLLDHSEYDAAAAFRNAVECADVTSDHCYQLYPGVVQAVRVAQTSSGEQDAVDISSRGSTIHVSLLPSAADASLLQAGAPVTVEWFVGSVATVWIGRQAIPSTANLAASHANFAYIGWILVWLAALFWAIVLLNRRMLALFAAVRILPATADIRALAGREVILPGGTTGWVVKPRAHEALLLPLLLVALVLISLRPLMNPDSRPFALVGDVLLFGQVIVSLALNLRNARVLADHASITRADWLGRTRSWPLAEIEQAAIVGLRWTDWAVPALLFVSRSGPVLFGVTSLYWNLDEIGALCVRLGVPLSVGYVPTQRRRINPVRLGMNLFAVLITGAFLVLSFLPLPPASS